MATKVHCETNLHMAFSNKNVITETQLKSELGDPWPHCAEGIIPLEDKQTHNRNKSCSNFMQETMEGHEEQDIRKFIRQTMVKHEEIFQEQVRELHRLYQVQKLLMAEVKNKTICTPKLASATTQTSPFIFQFGSNHVQLEGKRNFWHPHNGFVTDKDKMNDTNFICGRNRDQTLCSDFLGQNLRIGLSPIKSKDGSQDFYRLQPSKATCSTFDLEQPAEEFMNDKSTYPNRENTSLRTPAKITAKEDKSLNFQLFPEPDTDLQLTLGIGSGNGKMESNSWKTPPSLGLAIPEFMREQKTECRGPLVSDDLKLYSPASVRSEATIQERSRVSEGTSETSHEYKNYQDCRAEWQRFDIENDKSRKERHPLDLQIGERSKQENLNNLLGFFKL